MDYTVQISNLLRYYKKNHGNPGKLRKARVRREEIYDLLTIKSRTSGEVLTVLELVFVCRFKFRYIKKSGILVARIDYSNNKLKAGSEVGALRASDGRRRVQIGRKMYLVHRIIWLMWYGDWPEFEVDHIDRDHTNNRIDNLRDINHKENGKNQKLRSSNTSGVNGVHRLSEAKWLVHARSGNGKSYLGSFRTKKEAIKCREKWNKKNACYNGVNVDSKTKVKSTDKYLKGRKL